MARSQYTEARSKRRAMDRATRLLPPKDEQGTQHTKEFIDLQALWYAKLACSGFEDIEHTNMDGGSSHLLRRSSQDIGRKWRHDDEEYHRLAGQYLWSTRWVVKGQRSIWRLHSDGLGYKEIAAR